MKLFLAVVWELLQLAFWPLVFGFLVWFAGSQLRDCDAIGGELVKRAGSGLVCVRSAQ